VADKHLVFEEGLQGAWLYETLSPHVDELIVAGITQSRGPKSDKRDAYGLAEKLRVGNLDKYVFKSPRQFTMLREFSRTHMTLVTDVVRTQARIKSVYRSRGVPVAGVDVYGPRRREEWLKQLPASSKIRATRLYTHLDFLLEQKKQAEADLLREGKKHPIVKILETAPGFGPIRAARLVPIVITPHRFRTKRQFWSYCGLGIVTRSSSDWVQTADGAWIKTKTPQTRGLSRQHNRFLKSI
jgi:transposase